MPSTNPLHTTVRRPDPTLRRRTRLAGVIAAMALAFTLAACGSSESDQVEDSRARLFARRADAA